MTYLNWLAQQDLETCTFKSAYEAGAASRDAEIHHLQMALADTEALEAGTAERCDQLREQVALLRKAVTDAANHVKPTCFDLYDKLIKALAATEPKS